MSWQSYIDQLVAHDQISDAAIWGKNLGQESQWASSPGLCNITAAEIKKLACDNKESLRSNGPCVGGKKCMFLRDKSEDPNVLSLDLKTLKDEDGNSFSVCIGVSHTAFIIAKGTAASNGGTLAQEVFKIVEHLKKNNI